MDVSPCDVVVVSAGHHANKPDAGVLGGQAVHRMITDVQCRGRISSELCKSASKRLRIWFVKSHVLATNDDINHIAHTSRVRMACIRYLNFVDTIAVRILR
jgi:hypothetical protein